LIRSAIFAIAKLAGIAGFFYAFGGWMLIPPSVIFGAF